MPSSKNSNLKDIYVANSIGELNSLADPKIPANKGANPTLYCKSADKVFVKAQDYDVTNDEENAYVFYMRYFKIISLIKNTTKYRQEKVHFDKLLGESKSVRAIQRAEKLAKSLLKRYDEAKKQKEDEEMAKKLVLRKEEEEAKAKKAKKKDNSASVDDDLDDLLNNPGISSSSEVFQRLKVNHSSVLTPQGAQTSNGDIHSMFATPSPLLPGMGTTIPCVTAEDLYTLIKTVDGSMMLIIDVRPCTEFAKNHILHPSCISIPAEMLEQGVAVSNIERRLMEKTRLMWRQRGTKDYIIILDKSTKVSDVSPVSMIQQLKDAIYKYDSHCTLQKEPLFLDGGFDGWLWHYPSLATRSELPTVSSSTKLADAVDLSTLDYPDLPVEKEETKLPSPTLPETTLDMPTPKSPSEFRAKGIDDFKVINGLYPTIPGNPNIIAGNMKTIGPTMVTPGNDVFASGTGSHHDESLRSTSGQGTVPSPPSRTTVMTTPATVTAHQNVVSGRIAPGQAALRHVPDNEGITPDSQTPAAINVPATVSSYRNGPAAPSVTPMNQQPQVSTVPHNSSGQAGQARAPVVTSVASAHTTPVYDPHVSDVPVSPAVLPSSSTPTSHSVRQSPIGVQHPTIIPGGYPTTNIQGVHPPTIFPSGQSPTIIQSGQPPTIISSGQTPTIIPSGQTPTIIPSGQPPTIIPSGQPPPLIPGGQPPTSIPGGQPPTSIQGGQPPTSIQGGQPPTSIQGGQPPTSIQGGQPPTSIQGGQPPTSIQGGPPATNIESIHPSTSVQSGHLSTYGQTESPELQRPAFPQGSLAGHPVGATTPNQGGATLVGQPQDIKGYETSLGLPPGWEKCVDKTSGRVFYKNHKTQTTHWDAPKPTGTGPQPGGTPVQPQIPQQQPHSTSRPGQPIAVQPHQPPTSTQPVPSSPQHITQKPHLPTQSPHPKSHTPQMPHTLQTAHISQTPKYDTSGKNDQPKSKLRRSLSSPNLAKLDNSGLAPVRPVIDRSSKPAEPTRPSFNRSSKPLTTLKLEALNPIYGGLGCGLTGLRNLGNTCYMNSVLQCLFNTAPLAAYFISGALREDINTENPLGTRGELAEQFSILVRVANSGQFKSISPADFKKTVSRVKQSFAGYDQQDSQEFLALMMDKLHEDVNKIHQKPHLKAPGDDVDPESAAEITWANHKRRNESMMVELFDGLFKSTVCCLTCQKESVTFETFSNLTLPLPSHGSRCTLQDCITLFTRPEKMSGDDKWYCPRCKQHKEASKQLQIWRLPPILVIHLKRFQYDGMWRQKLQTGVSFPCSNLDMSSSVAGTRSHSPYHLYGVSNHYGTMHGGHYTAFCRNSWNKHWYKFDDQVVTEISSKDIVTSAAYLLFYTSFDFKPPKLF